jgi:ComF family protein
MPPTLPASGSPARRPAGAWLTRVRAGLGSGQCEVCRLWTRGALCGNCVARFAAPRPRCERCAIGLGAAAPACGACLREPPAFERSVCAADYAFPWDRLVGDFKFHGRVELAPALAGLMVAAVRRGAGPLPDLVLPVPLSAARLRERGYNQAALLARAVAAPLGLPCDAQLLQSPLATAHQAGLSRAARQRNLRHAFMVDPRRRSLLQGRRVALVDDVMTTGATAREATRVLLQAGASAVQLWVLARTPDSAARSD